MIVADDHGLFRRGLRELLEAHGFEVVGEASNGRTAVRLFEEQAPDVIVMDLSMPIMDGVSATREILAGDPSARVLVLTITADEDGVIDALVAGARGYLLKDAEVTEIIAALHAAAAGHAALSPGVAARLVDRVREDPRPARPLCPETALTAREREILRLIAEGRDNAAIARELVISPSTVKNHIANILDKLGVDNRIQAAVIAVKHGLV